MSPHLLRILRALHDMGGSGTLAEVAARIGRTSSTVGEHSSRLEWDRLVECGWDTSGGRNRVRLTLTEQGRRAVETGGAA